MQKEIIMEILKHFELNNIRKHYISKLVVTAKIVLSGIFIALNRYKREKTEEMS